MRKCATGEYGINMKNKTQIKLEKELQQAIKKDKKRGAVMELNILGIHKCTLLIKL